MKKIKDTRGFSLVELIITIAVMGILAGVVMGALGYINSGKTKKASAKLNSRLNYIQTETMTKEGRCYLYLFKTDDGVFSVNTNEDASGTVGNTGLETASEVSAYIAAHPSRTQICDDKVKVTASTPGGNTVELVNLTDTAGGNQVNVLKIGYSKATGAFSHSCGLTSSQDTEFYNSIKLEGKQTFYIKMVEKTGKHYVDR